MNYLLLLFSLTPVMLQAQVDGLQPVKKKNNYKVWVKLTGAVNAHLGTEQIYYTSPDVWDNASFFIPNEYQTKRADLLQLNDNSILIATKGKEISEIQIPISEIEAIGYRRKGATTKGILIGSGVGLLTSGIGWLNFTKNCQGNSIECWGAGFAGIITSAVLTISGGVIGGLIGSNKKKIQISGSQKSYEKQRIRLEQHLLVH